MGNGSGLGLFARGRVAVGGIGVAGDHTCTEHSIAWRARNLVSLDRMRGLPPPSGDPMRRDNIVCDITPNPAGGAGRTGSSPLPPCRDVRGSIEAASRNAVAFETRQ
jgi:hypothetical protein